MGNSQDYQVYSQPMNLKDLNLNKEYTIELEWLIEFSDELTSKKVMPDGTLYTTHSIGTIKWNPTLGHWQLMDIAIVDCENASLFKVYDLGEVVDLKDENILVTKSSLRVVKRAGKGLQRYLDQYVGKPKAKDLSILRCEGIDNEFNKG